MCFTWSCKNIRLKYITMFPLDVFPVDTCALKTQYQVYYQGDARVFE